MKPGRELDSLVALKVMGCKVGPSAFQKGPHCLCPDEPHEMSNDEGSASWLKPYSIDISAAWEVLAKFPSFNLQCSSDGNEPYFCEVFTEAQKSEEYSASGERAPHVICLAALKSVGVEIKD